MQVMPDTSENGLYDDPFHRKTCAPWVKLLGLMMATVQEGLVQRLILHDLKRCRPRIQRALDSCVMLSL